MQFHTDIDVDGDEKGFPIFKIIFIIFLVVQIFKFLSFDETVLKNVDMEPFSEPFQETIENPVSFKQKIKGGEAIITPIANYKIYGRVYQHHYRPLKLYGAAVEPYDVSIGFGDFRHKDVYKFTKVRMAGTTSYLSISGKNWAKITGKYFMGENISHFFTNNHLCPANNKVRRGISRLRNKDIVYIEGYLIKYEYRRKNGRVEKGISSTTRDDQSIRGDNGNGNCEQIYVTRIVTRHGDYR